MNRNEPINLSLVGGGGETKTAQNNGPPTAAPLAIGVIFTFTDLPEDVVWFTLLQQYLSVREIARLGRLCSLFNDYWENAFPAHRPIPVRVSTIEEFMRLAVVLTTKNMCSQSNPLVFELSEGVHVDGNDCVIPCSNLTLVGRGQDQTTIRGGLVVNNQTNIVLKDFNVTNPDGSGLHMEGSETNVEVVECTVQHCKYAGMSVSGGATVVATRCEFMENGYSGVLVENPNTKATMNDCTSHHNSFHGLIVANHAVVDLHGEATGFHNNKGHGISALNNGKINIHLSSQHNTSHDNTMEDRKEERGSIVTH